MLFSSLLTLFGYGCCVVPGMGREELPHSEGIRWSGPGKSLSNGTWSFLFLRHYFKHEESWTVVAVRSHVSKKARDGRA
jgi:hypothetical protein